MLILQFQVGGEAFAVDFRRIVEVAPLAHLRPLPGAAAYVAGLLHYRGRAVPVLNVNRLLGAVPSEPRLSTRIILVEPSPGGRLLGLLAERVSDLKEVSDGAASPLSVPGAPCLGPVLESDGGLVQLLSVERMGEMALGEPLKT